MFTQETLSEIVVIFKVLDYVITDHYQIFAIIDIKSV